MTTVRRVFQSLHINWYCQRKVTIDWVQIEEGSMADLGLNWDLIPVVSARKLEVMVGLDAICSWYRAISCCS